MMHPSNAYVATASQLNGYSGLESSWGETETYATYMEARDTEGNLYRVYSDGKISLIYSASGGTTGQVWTAGTMAYDAVLAALKAYSDEQSISISIMVGGGAVTTGGGTTEGTGGVVSWISGLFAKSSTSEERAAAYQQLEGAASQYGPGIISAVQTLLGNQGSSLASLQSQLARKQAKYATTTNATRKLQLKYEIEALQSQIAQYEQAASGAQSSLVTTTTTAASPIAWWIPVSVLGGIGLLVVIGVAASRRR